MNTFYRIFHYARPVGKFAIPYCILIVIHSIFNMLNFALIIPILTTLFDGALMQEAVTVMPDFHISAQYFQDLIKYLIYVQFGSNYSIPDVLEFLSVVVVLSVMISNIARFGAQKIIENFRIHSLQNMRDALFSNLMRLNVRFFSNERKGDILSKLTSDINVVQFCVTNTLQVIFKEPALIITYFIALVGISGKLTLFTLAILPFTALIIGFIIKKLRRAAHEAQESMSDMVSVAEEALSGVKVVKSYCASDYVVEKFKKIDSKYSDILRSMAVRQQMASPMSEFLGVGAISIILLFGGNMVIGGEIDGASFIAYLAIFSQVTRPARAITDAFSTIHQGLAAGDRIIELIDTKPEIEDNDSPLVFDKLKDKIEFKNVTFSYDENRDILHNISFEINKGETVALVGSSGGGKSTIADLIPRFYDVTGGEILIDGINVKDYKMSSLHRAMGIVSQEVVLFNDTIENNILLGDRKASRSDVEEAAKVANAHEFIMASEYGYETSIGDRGAKLSGGQRQRLSIARAVLHNPDILILDEATSALDTESEKLVQESISNLLKGRTSLIIAHRLSTISNADKIIVVDNGKICECGTHQELIKLEGVYFKLTQMQQV